MKRIDSRCAELSLFIVGVLIVTFTIAHSQTNLDEALLKSVKQGNLNTISALIKAGGNVNALIGGTTTLHEAITSSPYNIVALLIDSGAQLDKKNNNGETPLVKAAQNLRFDVVRSLLEKGAKDYSKVIFSTIDKGLDVDLSQVTVVERASIENNISIAKLIIDLMLGKGANINETGSYSFRDYEYDGYRDSVADSVTALNRAMATYKYHRQNEQYFYEYHYPLNLIQFLIDRGADINKPDSWGYTPLISAVVWLNTDAIRLLLQNNNLKINDRSKSGKTALMYAIDINLKANGRNRKAFLVSNWILENRYGQHDQAWREINLRDCRQEIINRLLENDRTDVNVQDNHGLTALSYLIRFDWKPVYPTLSMNWKVSVEYLKATTRQLIRKGADINLQGKSGKSPLIYAVDRAEKYEDYSNLPDILTSTKRISPQYENAKSYVYVGNGWTNIPETIHVGDYFCLISPTDDIYIKMSNSPDGDRLITHIAKTTSGNAFFFGTYNIWYEPRDTEIRIQLKIPSNENNQTAHVPYYITK